MLRQSRVIFHPNVFFFFPRRREIPRIEEKIIRPVSRAMSIFTIYYLLSTPQISRAFVLEQSIYMYLKPSVFRQYLTRETIFHRENSTVQVIFLETRCSVTSFIPVWNFVFKEILFSVVPTRNTSSRLSEVCLLFIFYSSRYSYCFARCARLIIDEWKNG